MISGTPVHVSIIPNEPKSTWYVRVHFHNDHNHANRLPPFPMNVDFPMFSENEAKELRDVWNLVIENSEVQLENNYTTGEAL